MINIEFVFESQNMYIQGNSSDPFKKMINHFCNKVGLDKNGLYFIMNGMLIEEEEIINKYIQKLGESKVLVERKKKEDNKDIIEKSKDIICPECKEQCRIKFNEYKIKLDECSNGHINEIKIGDLEKHKI